ncbi:MAG: hypothetical protein WBE71_01510 [Xanthobacteraceae bacterium]
MIILRPAGTLIVLSLIVLRPTRTLIILPLPVERMDLAALDRDLPADRVRRVEPLQDAAVARRLLRRNLIEHGHDAAVRARPQREAAGALRQGAEPPALPVEHFDASDMAVGVRIELDGRRPRAARRRHFDDACGAANAECRIIGRNLHVAGLGDEAGNESGRPGRHMKRRGITAGTFLIDELVDDDARIGRKAECRLVVEGDTERRVQIALQRVVFKNVVGDLQGDRGDRAAHRGAVAVERRDLTDRFVVGRHGHGALICCWRRRRVRLIGRRLIRRCRRGIRRAWILGACSERPDRRPKCTRQQFQEFAALHARLGKDGKVIRYATDKTA